MWEDNLKETVTAMSQLLFLDEEKAIYTELVEIGEKHKEAYDSSQLFLWKGKPVIRLENLFNPNQKSVGRRKIRRKPLHSSLVRRYSGLALRIDKIDTDQEIFRNFWGVCRPRIHNEQDLRDALPDVVVNRLRDCYIKGLPRTREEGYCFPHPTKQGKLRIYEQMVDMLHHYLSKSLMY